MAAKFLGGIVACAFIVATDPLFASEEGEKKKIEKRYEVVAWGKKQSLRDNAGRVIDAIASKGTDWTVYEKRYRDLKFHWDEMKKKGVDKNETIYFGMIDWWEVKGVKTDHFVRFYVAARKRDKSQLKDGEVIALENRARSDLFLDIDGAKGVILPLQKFTGFGGCDWVLENKGKGHFALKNRYSETYLDVSGRKYGDVVLAKYTPHGGCDWRLEKTSNGHHKLINRYWTEKKGKEIVLDITKEGRPIVAEYTTFGGCDWKVHER